MTVIRSIVVLSVLSVLTCHAFAALPTSATGKASQPRSDAKTPPAVLMFDVTFDDGYKLGDKFDPTGAKAVNQLAAKPGKAGPYRKLTDIRNTLNGKQGKWTATVVKGEPFETAFLRFDVPAGEPLAGRFELFEASGGDRKGLWFVEFEYARLLEGKGGPEALVVELKSRAGSVLAAPAMWYGAFLGDWKNVKSNREMKLNRASRIRLELDFDAGKYRVFVDGEKTEEHSQNLSEFGGASFVFGGKTADHALAFGIDNLRVGRVITGPPVAVKGEIVRGDGKASNLLLGEEVIGGKPVDMTLTLVNRYPGDVAEGVLELELYNDRGTVASLGKQEFRLEGGQTQTVTLPVPVKDYGWFGIRGRLAGAKDGIEAGSFCVLRKPAQGLRPESFFGLTLRSRNETAEDFDAAERMGVKWKRGLDLQYVYPGKVRPAPDRWWDDATRQGAIDNAIAWKKAGVSILGYIDYNIPWNVAKDAKGKPIKPVHQTPPADMNAHAEMVEMLVSTLKDHVKHWELWNEPGGFFWGGTSEQYREMLKTVYERVKPKFPEIQMIGGGHYMWISRDWVFLPHHDNAGYVDGMALHPYGRPGLGTPISAAWDAALIKNYSKGKGSGGLWATELGTLPHWLFTMHPKSDWPRLYARSIAPVYLLNKIGAGETDIKVFWFFSDYGKGQSENTNFWTYNNPTPAVAAYSAMTHFLEDGKLQGDLLAATKKGWALHFVKPDGVSVVALWPETTWPAEPFSKADNHESVWTLPAMDFEAYDYLGRKIDAGRGETLSLPMRTQEVVYLTSRRPIEQVQSAVRQATFEGLDPLRINPQPITRPLQASPVLRVKVRNETLAPADVTLTVAPPAELVIDQPTVELKGLAPGATQYVDLPISRATPRPDNRYPVAYTAQIGQRQVKGRATVQVACAGYGAPTIDGDLADWADATFVSIRNPGPLADWWQIRPSMTLGEGYRLATKWDNDYFYVAAEVPDQTSKLDTTEPKTDQEKMEYRNRGNDRLHVGFNVIEDNPDDLLRGHPLYNKSLASDIDYEFMAELKPGKDGAAAVPTLNRRLYPGSRYVTGGSRPEFTPPIGRMDATPEGGKEGRIQIRYDSQRQVYVYELAIPLVEMPPLREMLAKLTPGQSTAAAFGFMVNDGHKWDSTTHWCEEVGDIEFGAYGFDRRVGSPCWLNDYSTRLQTLWGFAR